MTPARLSMHGIRKRFGATIALDGVDLHVAPGEVLALVGENGAGKSTLMRILAGALTPDGGTMTLDGGDYEPRAPVDARRHGVAMIHQELSLAPHLSVMENIVLGDELGPGPFVRWRDSRARAAAALARVGRDDIPLDDAAASRPIAEQQLIEIARAVAVGSRVLVFDEPTSSLGAADARRLLDLIRRLRAEGLAIIAISHVLEEVRAIADRVTILRDGRTVGGGAIDDLTTDQIITLMVGRDVDELYPRQPRTPGEVVLDLKEVAGERLPRDATLTVRRGEVFGIAGLVGAGRTELLRAIFGLDAVTRGRLRVGRLTGPASPTRHWAAGTGFVSEDRKTEGLALSWSVAENLCLPRLDRLARLGLVTPAAEDRAMARWVERLGIRCASVRQTLGALSGGNQQKVAIARLLFADVDLLLLDEPTRGIDVGSKAQIYALIDELASADPARAVLIVSSALPELLGVCDRIAVMTRGVLGPARDVAAWDAHGIMVDATGGAA
ncbi:MAG: sugar ABC transporter ATP-binding protein [Phycisphaerales bacterium]|nr:sugar ABC transporter ATP-binding protein [Phycisphaerales bacterium]